MAKKGKQQVLFSFLPGKVFDYMGTVIAKVTRVRGNTSHRLNHSLVIRKVAEQARAWGEEFRLSLSEDILTNESNFALIDPTEVESEMFPLVFWCSDNNCKKVFDYSRSGKIPASKVCSRCKRGRLRQLRYVKIHKCGNLEPLTPMPCRCGSTEIALDDRDSEKFGGFKWKCLTCQNTIGVFGGNCTRCSWPNGQPIDQQMNMEVFRSGRSYYVHTATLINIPANAYNNFFQINDWYKVVAAKYLAFPALNGKTLIEYANGAGAQGRMSASVSEVVFGELLEKLNNNEITPQEYAKEVQRLRSEANDSVAALHSGLLNQTGIEMDIWEKAKYDILDSVIPFELGSHQTPDESTEAKIKGLGLEKLILIDDFPIILASYAFSRTDARPRDASGTPVTYLSPFPRDDKQEGKFPIYVDKIQADALLIRLDPDMILKWLEINDQQITLPVGSNSDSAKRAFFLSLFYQRVGDEIRDVNIYEKIFAEQPVIRLVLGLLHTYSHFAIKQAALLCGLDKTSISEYIVPKTLSVVLYCNHRFGATIGALTALFEQSMSEWLDQIENERRCVYDPVCYENGATCHSCTHLAETSCKLFNQNLSRSYLFGGFDHELQKDIIGFFDPRVQL